MNAMERVTAMLSHKEVDRIPVYPILSGVTRKLVGATYEEWATNADVCADALYKAVKQFDLDGVVTLIDLSVECDAWGQKLIFHENDAPHPDYSQSVIQDIEDYAKIKKADYKQSKRMMMHIEVCRQLVEKANGEFPVTAFVFGPLGTLSMLRNQEDMYMDLYDDPDAVKEAVGEVTETLKDYVNALIDTGIQGVMFDTLFASGTIMSKDMWIEMESDAIKVLADVCHERGVLVMIHNCGENRILMHRLKRPIRLRSPSCIRRQTVLILQNAKKNTARHWVLSAVCRRRWWLQAPMKPGSKNASVRSIFSVKTAVICWQPAVNIRPALISEKPN